MSTTRNSDQPSVKLIDVSTNATDESLRHAMNTLLSGQAQPRCKICLSYNHLTLTQIDIILEALADERCPPGIDIFLFHCHLNNEHARKFAQLFANGRYSAGLRLHFDRNSIGDDGFLEMIHALSRNIDRPGVYLDMQHNDLTDVSADELANLIAGHQLTDGVGFNLTNNPELDTNTLQRIATSLETTTAVTEFFADLVSEEMRAAAYAMRGAAPLLLREWEERASAMKLCCKRNLLLQKYRNNPDFIHQIYDLFRARVYELPRPTPRIIPSLRFFAITALPQTQLQKLFDENEGTFECLRDAANGMQDITKQLNLVPENRTCPWPCTIL
jgi:hypothetical protein